MKVLIACEESQRVCAAFRQLGHEAYSCDIQEPSGGHPEWHILGDVLQVLDGGIFVTMDGVKHDIGKWDLMIAHPPCTYLSNVATRSFSLRCSSPEKVVARWENRAKAAVFFMRLMQAPIDRIAVENPLGFMNTAFRKADQIISPWMFAESENDIDNYWGKRTCLWLKGLPPLKPTGNIKSFNNADVYGVYQSGKAKCWKDICVRGSKDRSKTALGIAEAMAKQWGAPRIAIMKIPPVKQPMSAVEYERALQELEKWCFVRGCFNCEYHDACGRVIDGIAENKVAFVEKWVKDQRGEN